MEASIVNRLIGVTKALTSGAVLAVTQFGYDGDGIRVRKSDPSGTTLYPLAGSELALSGAKGQVIGLTEVTLAYTPPAGMGITGVSADGFDLRKRGATVAWDAGVFDGQHAITLTGFAQVRVETQYSGYRLFGLTTSDIGGGFCPTRYGLELVHGGALEVYENCVRVAYPPTLVYGAGDQLRIEADAGVVRYKRQVGGAGTWEVLYTSTLPVTAALYFNASLYTPGSTLKEIRFVSGSTGAPSVQRTYYMFGVARVAMRDGAGAALVYLHGDQLGSSSLATSMTGMVLSQQRYAPYGEVRWRSGAGMPTDFTFTGQRAGPANYVGSLMDYNARLYSPALGKFVSADTIVPGAGNPQAFNRYMYVLGNPLGMIDPSGHFPKALLAVLIGAAVGAFVELSAKSIEQTAYEVGLAASGAKPLDVAVADIIYSKENQASRVGAAAGGATQGAIIGALGASKAGSASLGAGLALASVSGGQVESLVGGLVEEGLVMGDRASLADAGARASGRGFLEPVKIAVDAGLGVFAGIASDSIKAGARAAVVESARNTIKKITHFQPYSKVLRPSGTSLGKTNVVNLNLPQQIFVGVLHWLSDTTVDIVKRKVSDTVEQR